jgi:hypothetical protein
MGLQGLQWWRRTKVVINDTITEHISSFNYLGCKISDKLNECMELNIVKYNKMNGIIKNQCMTMTKDVKERLYNVVAKSALRYCSETWVLGGKHKTRLEISQVRFARRLVRVTLRDRMRRHKKAIEDETD